ncbi:hypothetical protein GCM10010270_83660 [Streptomyces violaceus]|nr:hypothetical protein GCM10010270_83660 [Streptomyces janthinus]
MFSPVRGASCTAGIKVSASSINPTTDKEPVQLLPSHLMRSPRRSAGLVREVVKCWIGVMPRRPLKATLSAKVSA